jgi:hypothetical protein
MIESTGADQFFILTWRTLRDLLIRGHKDYLARHHGRRPKKWSSFHSAVTKQVLEPYRDRWDVISKNLK